jgi:hypothetical protein
MLQQGKFVAEGAMDNSRRDFIRKAAYVAPAILTLQAYSSLAKAGSNKDAPPLSEKDQRQARIKKILCELKNRARARQGLPPTPC